MEGSGSGYVQNNTDPDPDSGGPKNIRILQSPIRLRNTFADLDLLNMALDPSVRIRTKNWQSFQVKNESIRFFILF